MPLAPGTYSVGRHASNAIRIDEDSVSGRHCELTIFAEGPAVVRDVGSTNGICIEGARVGVGTLMPGQAFHLGQVCLHLEPDVGDVGRPTALGTEDEPMEAATPATPPGEFWGALAGAFAYPIRSGAWMTLACLALLQAVTWALPTVILPAGWLIGFLVGLYVFQLGLEIIRSTANGDDHWPSALELSWLGMDRLEILELIGKYVLLGFLCFGPAALLRGFPEMPAWVPATAAAAGVWYFPMALLAMVLADRLGAAWPTVVLPSIRRTIRPYAVVVLMFGLVLALGFLAERIPTSPGIGSWALAVSGLVAGAMGLYLTLVWLRVLGLFYRHHANLLNWRLQDE